MVKQAGKKAARASQTVRAQRARAQALERAREDLAAVRQEIDALAHQAEGIATAFRSERRALLLGFRSKTKRRGVRSELVLLFQRRYKLQVPLLTWRVLEKVLHAGGQRRAYAHDIRMASPVAYSTAALMRHAHGAEYALVRETEDQCRQIRRAMRALVLKGTQLLQSIYQLERHQRLNMDHRPASARAKPARPGLDQLNLPLADYDNSLPQLRNPEG